jgi:hypothetical protein
MEHAGNWDAKELTDNKIRLILILKTTAGIDDK